MNSIVLFGAAALPERLSLPLSLPLPHPLVAYPSSDGISAAAPEAAGLLAAAAGGSVFYTGQLHVGPHPDGLHLQPTSARSRLLRGLRRRRGERRPGARARPDRHGLPGLGDVAEGRLKGIVGDGDRRSFLLLGPRARALPRSASRHN